MAEKLQTVRPRRPQQKAEPDQTQVAGTVRLWDQKGNFIGSFHVGDPVLVTIEQADGSRLTGRLSVQSTGMG